jgi:Zn-finger nucleic acid-binding protein/DNA-directed RNA polymerase subunit RPC12/RpoP
MNCPHCGAPMILFRERDYYYCEHCQSYHFPKQDQEGLRVLGENPEGIPCPHCRDLLHLITYDDFFQGYQCPKCQGLLFNRTIFREAIDFRRSRIKTSPEPFSHFNPDELDRATYCPSCQKKMETFQYNGPGNIVIDTCHPCDLIWLDHGELRKVVNAPGKDRGVPRPKPSEEDKEDQARDSNDRNETSFKDLIYVILDELFD